MGDWAPGDLAQYVRPLADDAFVGINVGLPIVGLSYTVTDVQRGWDCYGREGIALKFAEIGREAAGWVGYNADAFRKITPRAADAEDLETIEIMLGGKVHQPAPCDAESVQ